MQRRRRPRALTLTLPDAKQPFVVLEGEKYTLRNFSEQGMGIWVSDPAPAWVRDLSHVDADVTLAGRTYRVSLEIRHHTPRFVGVRILKAPEELTLSFRRLLEPATHSAELRLEGSPGEEDPRTGYPRLQYSSPTTAELTVWYNDFQRVLIAVQLVWASKWVYREQYKNPETGHLREAFAHPHGKWVEPKHLVEGKPGLDHELLQEAAQFLVAAPPPIPGNLLWTFLETGEQIFLPAEYLLSAKVA